MVKQFIKRDDIKVSQTLIMFLNSPTAKIGDIKEQPEHEITVGNYTTKFFYMCGSAQKVMKQNADVEGAEELTRLQDDFYKLEKEVDGW